MARVQINTAAPEFTLEDFRGRQISLADFRDRSHLVLVFNRGFA